KIGFGDATVHELKTLLTAIIVSAELLVEELQATKESMPLRLTQNIIRSAHSLDEKLSHFSEMAGLLSGEFSFQPELLEVEPIVHGVTSQIYPITHSRNQSLNVDLPTTLPRIIAHHHYLEQIILNLLANASKFTPEGGSITVSATKNDTSLIIVVADNGIGISTDKQELVFQPYFQVSGGKGSGLGLAITKFLVELHGGTIHLESTPGKGSRFTCSLPLPGQGQTSEVN
ncbi:MAG: HAMP domain-containing histidine kinase, partial [Dehalococcoidia bacterium]|nr:HAMP domain-containing histidine kinase [Dehalococcoidia bacterium]